MRMGGWKDRGDRVTHTDLLVIACVSGQDGVKTVDRQIDFPSDRGGTSKGRPCIFPHTHTHTATQDVGQTSHRHSLGVRLNCQSTLKHKVCQLSVS